MKVGTIQGIADGCDEIVLVEFSGIFIIPERSRKVSIHHEESREKVAVGS